MNPAAGMASAWAMARGEPGWEARTDMSVGGVFASFWAVSLALPAIILTSEVGRRAQLEQPGATGLPLSDGPLLFAVASVLAALLCWGGSLVVLAALARRASDGWRVSPLIVGYNWSRLIVDLVAGLGAAIAVGTGLLPVAGVFGAVSGGLRLFLDLGVIRHALGIALGQALGAYLVVLLLRFVAGVLVVVPLVFLSGGAPG